MKANPESKQAKLLEFQKRVMWQRQQVNNLRDMSPWNRSYDYIVRLLARSLFTILERITPVFGIGNSHVPIEKQQYDSPFMNSNSHHSRNHSLPALMLSSVHPSETNPNPYGSCSELVGSKPLLSSEKSKRKKKEMQLTHTQSVKHLHSENKHLKHSGSFKGCMPTSGGSMRLIDCQVKNINDMKTVDKFSLRVHFKLSLKGRLRPGTSTLGDAALALHYANVIVLIEKIVSAPHPIDLQIRDDLYNMLPTTIRTALRTKLKWYAKSKVHDASLAAEWSVVLSQILEWLAPLAHNMVRWHCERNFEKEHDTLKASVLLVQTLYFASQPKTEAAMVELLVGLQYVWRIDREASMRDASDFAGSRSFKRVR
uniref:DUF668 domain-containing protein n=1 Tax=Lotus japonicus TaxID=34305 RepID=I3S8U1_LOTJA|nr:unknown [Lotus japonicus]